jgi:hypothetical protein
VIDELIFAEVTVSIVADEHALRFIGYTAFEADVGTGQRIVACDHDYTNLSIF